MDMGGLKGRGEKGRGGILDFALFVKIPGAPMLHATV